MKIYALIGLVLAMAVAANAARLQQDDGDYGDVPTPITYSCLGLNGQSVGTMTNNCAPGMTPPPGTAMIGQEFPATNGTQQVFDYLIFGNRSNFTLTLTGTEMFSPDSPPNVWGWGAFICNTFAPTVQCGPDPTSQLLGMGTLSSNGKTATFDVTGTNDGSHPFVFFAVEPDSRGTVTAAITTNTPEPGSFSLIVVGMVAAFGRRRLARLL